MSLRERIFGSRTDTTTVFAAMDDEWRFVPDIVERAGYHPNTHIYVELARLERDGDVESCWENVSPLSRRRVYRKAP